MNPPMPEQTSVTMQGIDMRLFVGGDGPPLLFLHGGGGFEWRPDLDMLARRFKVYAPEHPGFGLTERPDWLETAQDLAIWTMDLIDELGLGEVHLAGHSVGGWVAAELASLCSHQLRKLVLINAAGLRIPGEQRLDVFLATPDEIAESGLYDRQLADRVLAPPETPEAQRVAIRNRNMIARLGWNPYLCNPALKPRLRRIHVPTLIIWGRQDGHVPLSHGELYQRSIPGARLAVIDRCGHVPMLEQPDEFVRVVSDFLAE